MANFKASIIDNDTYRLHLVLKTINYLKVNNKYDFVKKIGQGTFGAVVELICPDKQNHVAAKIVVEELVSKNEINVWPELAHKNIVPLLTVAYVPTTNCYAFLTPLYSAALNDLLVGARICQDKQGFGKGLSLLKGVCSGLQYLHRRSLCHLDIKLSNVLVKDDGEAALCDFGSLTRTQGATDRLGIHFLFHYD